MWHSRSSVLAQNCSSFHCLAGELFNDMGKFRFSDADQVIRGDVRQGL